MVVGMSRLKLILPEDGWVEIGRRCSAGRRSVWARWIYRTEPSPEEVKIGARFATLDTIEAVELRAGREGGDQQERHLTA